MFGIVVITNAYLPDNLMSRQLYCLHFSYELGSHCMDRGD